MSQAEISDAMLAVLCRRIFRGRDSSQTIEQIAKTLGLTVEEVLDILEEAHERGIIE